MADHWDTAVLSTTFMYATNLPLMTSLYEVWQEIHPKSATMM